MPESISAIYTTHIQSFLKRQHNATTRNEIDRLKFISFFYKCNKVENAAMPILKLQVNETTKNDDQMNVKCGTLYAYAWCCLTLNM